MTDFSKFQVAKAFRHLDPTKGLADGISSGFSSIRYRGKAWALQHGGQTYPFLRADDDSPLTYIDIIILGIAATKSRVYFENQAEWNEDSASGPVCASLKGDVPDPGVPIQQAKSCGICPRSQWVTRPDGSRKPECQEHKRMAILLMPTMTKKMLSAPLLEPVYLKIPPGSFRTLRAYSDKLVQSGIPFASVITRISFSPPPKTFEFKFELVQSLTDAEAPLVLPLMEDQQTKQIIGSMPEIREIAPPPVAEKVETGLLSAFGAEPSPPENGNGSAPKRGPGRPPKAIKPPVEESKAAPAKEQTLDIEDYEESDPDLDESVAKVMGDKMKNMLK